MTFTNVFGNNTLPPSEYGYAAFSLTSNSTFVWPYNSSNAEFTIAKVMDGACSAGVVVTLPDARQVSTGEDFLIRNVGAETLTVNDASGAQVTQVLAGAASYFYLTDNSTEAGAFGVIAYGVGTSFVDAASLIGYGIKAIGASLNQSHPTFPVSSAVTISDDHRSKLVIFTGGAETFPLTSASTLGDDYFFLFRNEGTGTATLDPASAETIDGQATMQVQPGESLILICTGSEWFTVGYGRSVLYQFTQLTKDVSAGGTLTLTAAEASNKLLTFIGNPPGAVEVVVPAVVAVYYTQSSISTAQTIILKTAAGSGVGIPQGARIIAICDGTDVVSAQSAVANSSVSLTSGSAAVPSLYFATKTNSGLFKSGTQDVGVTVNGVAVGIFGSTGIQTATMGANSSQRHTVPAVSSDTIALLAATQTLTNKTISGYSNTLTNIGNASLTNSSVTINGSTVSLGDSITVTATASQALTIGTGLTGTSYNGSAPVTIAIDSSVVTLTGTQTLTNKTLTSPTISGGSINNTLILSNIDADKVLYTPAGAGSIVTDVQSKLRERVSVKDFGAVGDGVTDDTAAIQAALRDAALSGATLQFPPGTYVVTSTISLVPADLGISNRGVTIEGIGAYYGVQIKYTGAGYAFSFVGIGAEGGQPITRFQVKNIAITGDNNTTSEGGFLFERCYVVRLEDCSAVSWAKSTAHAVQIRNVFNFEVSGGNYSNGFPNGQGSHVFRVGSKSPDAWNTSNVIIRNTLIQRAGGYGVFIDQEANIFDNLLIDNVSFGSNMLGSFYANTTLLNNLTIKNCHFESAGKLPDNTLSDVYHVYVRGPSCVEVTNNSFQDAKWHARLENINSFVFENNKIFETGVYTIAASVGLTCVNSYGSVGANRIDTAQIDTRYSFDTASRVAMGILDTTEAEWFPTIFNAPTTYRNAIINRRERARDFDMLAVAPNGVNWRILNMSTRSVSWANTIPTTGSYTRGDIVYNEDPAILGTSGNQYTVLGWRRITTGSGHTSGTDWVVMRVLTGT